MLIYSWILLISHKLTSCRCDGIRGLIYLYLLLYYIFIYFLCSIFMSFCKEEGELCCSVSHKRFPAVTEVQEHSRGLTYDQQFLDL